MVLGMKYGVNEMDGDSNKKVKETVYQLDQKFLQLYKERAGSIHCNEILGFDMNDPEAVKAAKEKGIIPARCDKCIQDSVEILEKLLAE